MKANKLTGAIREKKEKINHKESICLYKITFLLYVCVFFINILHKLDNKPLSIISIIKSNNFPNKISDTIIIFCLDLN